MKLTLFFVDMGALSSTSPVQNSASSPTSPNDLNDMKISTETTPKPRKFFKSRNAAPSAEIQQQFAFQQQQQQQQQQMAMQHSNHVQHSPEENLRARMSPQKQTRKKQTSPKKAKVEKVKVQKPPKVKKEKAPKVSKIKEVIPRHEPDESEDDEEDDEVASPPRRGGRSQAGENTRTSGRVRGRMINYNEDEGEEEFIIRTEKRIAPRFLKGQQSMSQTTPQAQTITATSSAESQNLHSQNSMESSASSNQAVIHPPIVLRISKVRYNFKLLIVGVIKKCINRSLK